MGKSIHLRSRVLIFMAGKADLKTYQLPVYFQLGSNSQTAIFYWPASLFCTFHNLECMHMTSASPLLA